MAGLDFQANFSKSLAAGEGKRCLIALQVPTNQRGRIKRVNVAAKGGAQADKPARIEIASCSDDGTMDSLALKLIGPGSETIQTVGWKHKASGHVNPTQDSTAPLYYSDNILPFGGRVNWTPLDPRGLLLKGGQIFGVFVTADSGASVAADFDVTIDCEE